MIIINGVLYGADARVAAWVQSKLGGGPVAGACSGLGVLGSDGCLTLGALYFNRRDNDIEMALVREGGRMPTPALAQRLIGHAFSLGAKRISAECDASNTRVLKLLKGLGFQLEGVKRQAASDGGDKLIMGLLPDDCKLLRGL